MAETESSNKNDDLWLWFFCTLLASFMPCIVRYAISLGVHIESFDIKDILFATLAIVISNFTLVGSQKKLEERKLIIVASGFLLIPVVCFTANFLFNENNHNFQPPTQMIFGTYLFCIVAVITSFSANNILKTEV